MFRWVHRLSVPILVAFLATFALTTVMRLLVGADASGLRERPPRFAIEYTRAKRSERYETKKRTLPRKEPIKPVHTWAPTVAAATQGSSAVAVRIAPSSGFAAPGMNLAGGPWLGAPDSDSDVVPLVRINPRYPPKALARKVEGWVWLEFTITPHGTTEQIRIVDSEPRGYFERAALAAVQRYRYKPRLENGEAIERRGVQVVLSFEMAS